jgi:glycogen operon protein
MSDDSHSASLTLRADAGALQLIFNAYWEPLEFELATPDVDVIGWRRIVDTSLASPNDVAFDWASAAEHPGASYVAAARSVVVLAARRSPDASPRRRTK